MSTAPTNKRAALAGAAVKQTNCEEYNPTDGAESTGADRYAVQMVPACMIHPSPENDALYGPIDLEHDSKLRELRASIKKRGLEEPLILSQDNFIVSGHRRFFACKSLDIYEIPCRFASFKRNGADDWHRVLAEYNPQRIKTIDALLKEAMLQESVEETGWKIIERDEILNEERLNALAKMEVLTTKTRKPISPRREPFLRRVQGILANVLQGLLPVNVRQIHYNLLNGDPVYTDVPASGKPKEKNRYRNDRKSSDALERLCRDARYSGDLPMSCIDDPTRPQILRTGFTDVSRFIRQEVEYFLCGYHRHLSMSQKVHVEVFGEKNTLRNILEPVCKDYYVPLSLGRGFCSIPVWRDMEIRFRKSKKKKMILIVISDFDPEGLELADDALRSLRDLHNLPVEAIRAAVTPEQIKNFNLAANPGKETSKHFKKFLKRTGSGNTYECEALPPQAMRDALAAAIEGVFDMERFEAERTREKLDVGAINKVRRKFIEGF